MENIRNVFYISFIIYITSIISKLIAKPVTKISSLLCKHKIIQNFAPQTD